MKGYLHKIEDWFVIYDQRTWQDPSAEDGMLPLHPHDVAISSFSFYNGKEVQFEIIQYDGTIPILNAWNGYAKLVDSYPVSEETKPHPFCETPEEKCTMSYCDENGCINRKRNLVAEPSSPTETLYTEEQVIEFTMTMISQYVVGNTNIWDRDRLKETLLLKQPKKN